MRYLFVLTVAAVLAACSSSTTIVVASTTPAPTTVTSAAASVAPSPDTHAIDAACATLSVHLQILSKSLKGQSGNTTEDDMAFAAKQLDKAVLALEGTQAGSDLKQLANDAQYAGDYNGSDIGELLDRVGVFANDAKDFSKTYCQIL